MNFDFALVLVAGTFITGIAWLVDKVLFEKARNARVSAAEAAAGGDLPTDAKEAVAQIPWWADFSRSMFPVLAVVLVVRSFLIEPFQIPSGSMLPTLKIGDFILVNKFHYGLRVPVLNSKFVEMNEPERGDVVVFKFPQNPSINFIKRVVGLPGDVIRYQNKTLYVNGEAQSKELLAKLPPRNPQQLLFNESLGEVQHEIYNDVQAPNRVGQWTVPEGKYFVVGDNRDNSNDSRYWGYVPDELLVGKAFAVWMHWPELLSIPDLTVAKKIQ
ncbi:signal peptidase I [Neptunomonas marina]|uniref:Signal peptidase I n=1 Tax=Neptunomonas marina TaxID=1815562 RepID=A0A437Q8D5_9GAMM|nr:signal peptidase I [Neptunomonas marina]RVU30814.1 signal peptidase I [Neptunomonas marina]